MVLSLALFIGVHAAVRFTRIKDHHLRSYLFALPMLSPLIVYILYPPQLNIVIMERRGVPAFTFPPNPMFIHLQSNPPLMQDFLSISGTICISGMVLGVALLIACLLLNHYGSMRGLIPLSEEDYPKVRQLVAKRCKRLGIDQPHIGLVEDLRPNAFVGGHGRSTVLVFSLGMLQTFNEDEMMVAIDHELMHLKNRDTIFRSFMIGLIALSFFNPLAYFSYTAALREREHLADDGSTLSNRSRNALKSALKKAAQMTSQVEGMASASSLRLFGLVPLFPRNMLATHPAEAQRLESISRSNRERKASRRTIALTLLCVVILTGVLLAVFVDTRTILVHSSPQDMLMFGSNVPPVLDHGQMINSTLIPQEPINRNITFLPPPWIQNQTDFPVPYFVDTSRLLVATIATSN